MNRSPRKKVLIYYRYFGRKHGGGDYLPLTLIAALQQECDVTLALDWEGYFDLALEFYGISVDREKLRIEVLMPKDYRPTDHSAFLSFRRFRKLKKLAKDADIRIASDNIMDFGRPAHHFLSSLAFGDAGFAAYVNARDAAPRKRRFRELAEGLLRRLLGMRTRRAVIGDARERIYPNSEYVAGLLRAYYGAFNGRVFYPPTIFDFGARAAVKDPLKVVYIGRLEPDKRLPELIGIVERARAISGRDLTLSLAGAPASDAFKKKLETLTADKPWVDLPGEVHGDAKADFLLSASYAVHTMRKEAFGISITEYLKAGLIPIVPDEGGAREVVDDPELTFHSDEEAAQMLAKLLADEAFRESRKLHCAERAKAFSAEAYQKRQQELLKEIVAS